LPRAIFRAAQAMSDARQTIKTFCKFARTEFVRRGVQVFDKPLRQLFEHKGKRLVVKPSATHNQEELARMALKFPHCGKQVSLEHCLEPFGGTSLLHIPGAKLLIAVQFKDAAAEILGIAIVTNLTAVVIEPRFEKRLIAAGVNLPERGLWLELICAKPKTQGATCLLFHLMNSLGGTKECIWSNPIGASSRTLLYERHNWDQVVEGWDVIARLTKQRAAANCKNGPLLTGLLPGFETSQRLCTRGGIKNPEKTYYECR